jgi:hypothetical protein
MNLSFLESGVDSLKKGFENLVLYENIHYLDNDKSTRFFHLKDAILFIQHGIEILLKQILANESEYLLFSQLDENVKKAYKEKNEKGLKSVFESQLKHKIHTVTFVEAIDRINMLANLKLGKSLENKMRQLEIYRNIVMHSEPYLDEIEINNTFEGLLDELDTFFYQTIGEKYKTISGYSALEENYKIFKELLKNKNLEHKGKAIEVFLSSFKDAGVSIGINEVKRITNIDTAEKFLNGLFKSELFFGTDIYNGYCSGDVKNIKRISKTNFSMYTADNDSYYDFNFKSIILFVPELLSNHSPIIFFEIENDIVDPQYSEYIKTFDKIESLEYLTRKSDGTNIYNPIEINEIYNNTDIEENYETHFHFLTGGLWGFMNIQKLDYNRNYNSFIHENKFTIDGKKFEVILRNAMNNK